MIRSSFKKMNFKLLLVIFLTLLIPVIYRTTRIFFIGTTPDVWGFSIAGNLEWINVIFEVVEEMFLLPLFFSLRKIIKLKDIEDRNKKISWQIFLIMTIYIIMITFMIIFTRQLMNFMSVGLITEEAINFVRIEFLTRIFVVGVKLGAIFLIAKNLWKELIASLFLETIINILMDLFIVSDNSLSLQKGILWIGYDQLITSSFIFVVLLIFVYKKYDFSFSHTIPRVHFDRKSWNQHLYIGLESFIRNAFFIWFVIKTIDKLGSGYSEGDFWVMNSFIWDWLLLPIMALSQYLNRSQALDHDKKFSLKDRLIAPFILVGISVIIWIALIPTYDPFIRVVMNDEDHKLISHLAIISIGFYVVMAFNEPIDKVMIGDGKAQYILLQSIIVNIIVFIPYYYASKTMTISDVAIMMGTSIAVDSLITFAMFFVWIKSKKNTKNKNKYLNLFSRTKK